MSWRRVDLVLRGGAHDGLVGTVPAEVLALGFVIEAGMVKGKHTMFVYCLTGQDVFGRYVFMPPSLVSLERRPKSMRSSVVGLGN